MNKYLTLIEILMLIAASWSFAEAMQKCRPIRLVNGRARTQRQGRLVRFRCLKGYEFVGRRYMNCFHGQWDFERDPSIPLPMCVKPGCRASSYVNGHFLESYKGAVVSVVCNPGYTLNGSSTVYCNGLEWNEPFPVCKATNPKPSKYSNFDEDLCGWTQDRHGYWLHHEMSCSVIIHCDVTTESNPSGYMVLSNLSSETSNQSATIFSPVFPGAYSSHSCVFFWYKMDGTTAGFLKAFVKPEGVELDDLIPPFWVTGDQGSSWIRGFFPLYPSDVPFQLVFDGMSKPGNLSVIAFDSVEILSGEICDDLRDAYTPKTSTMAETLTDYFSGSCQNRCGSNSTDTCICVESCQKEESCCSDYEFFCTGDDTTSSPSTFTTEITTTSIETTTTAAEEANSTPKQTGYHSYSPNVQTDRQESTAATAAVTNKTIAATASPGRRRNRINFQIRVDPSHVSKTRIDGRFHRTGEESPLSIKSDSDHSSETSGGGVPPGTVEAVIAVAVLLVATVLVAAFIRRRKRKKTEKESMIEDSDVRFLTSDEFLDFTLARPADDDL